MAISHSSSARNGMADYIIGLLSGGSIEILDAGTTLLATLTLSAPAAPGASGGVSTFNAISPDTAADATGTAAQARMKNSGGTIVIDGLTVTATGGGGNITFATVSFVAGAQISVTSFTYTATP